MKDIQIQFSHPVKGKIQIRNKQADKKVKMLNFSSDKDFLVDIDINNLNDGNWIASLEWEHNDQFFLLKRNFEILNQKCIE
jgi:glycine cleavage system H lipoate-binding protein